MIMENNNAFKHRQIGLVTIAEAMARQWFGYVLYPDNWRHQWILTGLNSYVAYDIVNDVSSNKFIETVIITINLKKKCFNNKMKPKQSIPLLL